MKKPLEIDRTSKKNYKRIPFKFDLGSFWREILFFFLNFNTIYKKSNLEGVFEFLYPDRQLDQNLKPTRNLCGQLLYIYIYIYLSILGIVLHYFKMKKMNGYF